MNLQPAAVASVVITLVVALAIYQPKRYAWPGDQTGYSPAQPIEFSHKVHARDNSIPCEYCHSSARKGPVAGIPAASTCMNCHSQIDKNDSEVRKIATAVQQQKPIEWTRIHKMADFVRFDHSAHVSKGVACQTCHGPVERMDRVEQTQPMTMGWCVSCHRKYNAPPLTHRLGTKPSSECSACHY
jgi:cytochrome c7-like protein/class III cytochrome C family protein